MEKKFALNNSGQIFPIGLICLLMTSLLSLASIYLFKIISDDNERRINAYSCAKFYQSEIYSLHKKLTKSNKVIDIANIMSLVPKTRPVGMALKKSTILFQTGSYLKYLAKIPKQSFCKKIYIPNMLRDISYKHKLITLARDTEGKAIPRKEWSATIIAKQKQEESFLIKMNFTNSSNKLKTTVKEQVIPLNLFSGSPFRF